MKSIWSRVMMISFTVLVLSPPVVAEPISAPAASYQGGIKLVETAPYIKKVKNQIKLIERGAAHLDDEANIPTTPIQMHGDMIGAEKVVSVDFLPGGVVAAPRKAVVEKEMAALGSLVQDVNADEEAFNAGAQQLDLPTRIESKLSSLNELWNTSMNCIFCEFKNLQSITQNGVKNQNDAISNSAKKIMASCKSLEKEVHNAERVIKEQMATADTPQ
jgi:hypothetical protein